jgi:hypothetical protein
LWKLPKRRKIKVGLGDEALEQAASTGFSSLAYGGSRKTVSQSRAAISSRIAPLTWVFRLSQFCARLCYVASGGWQSLSPAVMGWAVPWPAT